jgi:hypothetical protein
MLACLATLSAHSQVFDTIGITSLRAVAPGLLGNDVPVGQAEAGGFSWEVNPAAVGQPISLFTWTSASGSVPTFPNAVGSESGHADTVAANFYGNPGGVAPGVAQVANYEAGYFYNGIVAPSTNIPGIIVNQSYIFSDSFSEINSNFDNYAAKYGVLFVNGAGNGGDVFSPASAYNCIAVGVYGAPSSTGPTADGRCKPDITAPAAYTSFSTPLVAGAAALLLEAAKEGAAGNFSSATNTLLLKTLLLNGAVKPPDWTNSIGFPLDARYGAGILQVLNSYRQLRGGKQPFFTSTSPFIGGSHFPPATTTNNPIRRGWDYSTISSTVVRDKVNHYFFDVTTGAGTSFVFSATLVWQKQSGNSTINNLDLFLYDTSNNALMASSQSAANNAEHIYLPALPPGRYDLQVFKSGAGTTSSETYGLAYDFGPVQAPRFTSSVVANGQFQSQVFGEPGQKIVVQGTTDFQSWSALLTNTVSWQGVFSFTNSAAGSFKAFRAFQQD